MIQLGLSWWQAWLAVWIGYGIVAPFIVLNARPGAIFHITFPVVSRTSFGIWGSLWCVFNRGAMAWWESTELILRWYADNASESIWYGVQASIGGSCLLVMLRAMWPSVNSIRKFERAFSRTLTNLIDSSESHARLIWNNYQRFYVLFPILFDFFTRNMVSDPQNVSLFFGSRCIHRLKHTYTHLWKVVICLLWKPSLHPLREWRSSFGVSWGHMEWDRFWASQPRFMVPLSDGQWYRASCLVSATWPPLWRM